MSIKRILRNKKFRKFIKRLSSLTDKRMKGKIKHSMEGCLVIIILAELSGCNFFREFILFAKKHERQLAKLNLIPNGIPSHDTLERIVHKIERVELDELFIKTLFPTFKGRPIIAIDGKNVRATKDSSLPGTYKGMKNHITAYLTTSKLSLMSESKGEKGNEMNVIPLLLKRLRDTFPKLKPYISIDGIAITHEILSLLKEYKYDFVICYKRSDENIEKFKKIFDSEIVEVDYAKNSSRVETRVFSIYDSKQSEDIEQWQKYISKIGRMDSKVEYLKTGEITKTTTFYFVSDMDLKDFKNVRRNHWAIENSLHYVLDNSFREDRLRMKKGSASENMNLLRKFVLNVLTLTNYARESVSSHRDSLKYDSVRELLYKFIRVMA